MITINRLACRLLEIGKKQVHPDKVVITTNIRDVIANNKLEPSDIVYKTYADGTQRQREFFTDAPGSKQYEVFLRTYGGCNLSDEEFDKMAEAEREAYLNIDVLNHAEWIEEGKRMYSLGVNKLPVEKEDWREAKLRQWRLA